ncbi:MAG TPA: GH1 family beta-glucosidase [Acidimicrobiia bacterium]|nr:GH1 family beta-glucosidase [Acidimicrobiia bacterium]
MPFTWGVATASYQIEGGRHEDGKGDSIWDRFSDEGRLQDRGDVAADHYHRWEEDLDLLAGRGIGAYRFSVAWSRVIPDGDGEVNRKGLDFYRRLVEGMAERGIVPYLTLYHWDLPQALQDKGGWASRQTVDAFARYAGVVADALGDLVGHWITQNEPWVAAMLGHLEGVFAPGISDWRTALVVGHHLLLSHGRAVEEIRSRVPDASVGIALDCRPATAASDSDQDVAAARHFDGFRNRWFFDPVFGRGYPEDVMRVYHDRGRIDPSLLQTDDHDLIATPIDFIGVNYYTTLTIAAGQEEADHLEGVPGTDPLPEFTETGWKIDPQGLESYLGHVSATYSPASILVTENGASYSDGPDDQGIVDDQRRISYLEGHIAAVLSAREGGAPVDGYFVWSFLDNLEWVQGFSQRFGLVWVDFTTGLRIPKASLDWYAGVAATGRLPGR